MSEGEIQHKADTLAAALKRRKNKAAVEKTKRLMAVLLEVSNLIDILTDYKKSIVAGTATKKQVGAVYYAMSKLSQTNRRIKGIFKDK